MLKIRLDNVGKLFNRKWVFKNLNQELSTGDRLAILGANGSGKSTLLRMLSGNLTPSSGEVEVKNEGEVVEEDKLFNEVAMAAPYLDLINDYSLEEHIKFHFKFKPLIKGVELSQIPTLLHLEDESKKPIKQYSSGMQQRVKLGLAILSDVPILLLDEPLTNLDAEGVVWYNELLSKYAKGRLVVICSNKREEEYQFCDQELIMENYK